jgi:hypothetical protein
MTVSTLPRRGHRRSLAALAALLALSALGVGAWALGVFTVGGATSETPARESIRLSVDASYPYGTLQQKIAASELIVIGTVGEPYGSRWNTPSGQLPETATLQTVIDQNLLIYTDYPVTIHQALKGAYTAPTVRVRVRGGQVGQDRVEPEARADLRPGERVLLMLNESTIPGESATPDAYGLVWGPFGKYTIDAARGTVLGDGGTQSLQTLRDQILKSPPGVRPVDRAPSGIPTLPAGDTGE